jgi:hypothetical protein
MLRVSCGSVWFYTGTMGTESDVPGQSSPGWVEYTFKGSQAHCSCYTDAHKNVLTYDSLERQCFNATDENSVVQEPCTEMTPEPWDYYTTAMFTSLQSTDIHPDYTLSIPEMLIGAGATGVLGFMWGSVAGAWGAIFAANQMASQAYHLHATSNA